MSELDAIVRESGMWPTETHPITGEPFIACDEFHHGSEIIRHTYVRRGPPGREVYRYEDDGPVWVRDLTDAELLEATDAWKKEDERWLATNGVFCTKGPTVTEGMFRTASNAVAQGYWAPKGWSWASTWTGKP